MIEIIAPENAEYMNEFMDTLPHGVLNKVLTGCGGTTIAINNLENYIIVVPNIEMIKCKCYYHSNLFGYYSGCNNKIEDYLSHMIHKPLKLMVTYDSIKILIDKLIANNLNPYNDFKLLVDEYQEFLTSYAFREIAIRTVIEESKKFNYCTYLSATPIPLEFEPEFISLLPKYRIVWNNTKLIKPIGIESTKPLQLLKNIITKFVMFDGVILDYRDDIKADELYIFCNSVAAIKSIIKDCGLTNNLVKVICSDTERNRKTLGNIAISNITDINKPINFITSKAYKGADFFSNKGIIIVYSDYHRTNTLVDVGIDMYQIMGRIRTKTNPFKNIIIHLYNTRLNDFTEEEFNKLQEIKIEESYLWINWFNKLSNSNKKLRLKNSEDRPSIYFYIDGNQNAVYNELAKKHKDYEYKCIKKTYETGLNVREALKTTGFYEDYYFKHLTESMIKNVCNAIEFKDKIEQCYLNNLCLDNKISEILTTLGINKIRNLKYNQKKVLVEYEYVKNLESIKVEILKLNLTGFYSNNELLNLLTTIYEKLLIFKKPKLTDITKIMKVKKKQVQINKQKINGFEINNN